MDATRDAPVGKRYREDPADGGPVDLEGDTRKYWAGRAVSTYREIMDKRPLGWQPDGFSHLAVTRQCIYTVISARLKLPTFRRHDEATAMMLLCGDVFEVLKSQKLGSMSNAPDQLRTPIQNQGRAKAGVHQVFTNMTQAQKAEWVRIFVEAVEGLPHERSSHFADRMVAGHWLLNKLEDKLNVVFIATEAFQKILDKALNMLRARGRIGFPGKRGTKELTLTHATNVDMEEAPAHAKTNDEMTERLVRYQVALAYQTGRADAYQEIIRRLLEKPRIDANVLDDFAPPNSPGIPGNDKTESANKSSKVSTPSTTFLAKLKVPFASASGIPSNNKTESAINRSKFSTPSATLLEDEPIIFASPLKAPSSPSDDSTESETSSFCRVRQQNVEETRWALEGQYTHEEYNDMESSEAGSHVSKRRSL